MGGSLESVGQRGEFRPWLLFIHQLPPKPDYLRVKTRRRLHTIGAVQLKPTVYLLPDSDQALEDFQRLRREVEAMGGSAMICRSAFLAGITDLEIHAMWEPVEGAESVRPSDLPDRVEPGRTWVTRAGVKVDRMASAWLIRRFIDPEARFKFVPAMGYQPAAQELGFDMFEGTYSHEGDLCTFQVLQHRFGLEDRSLTLIGEIVHDIDCKDHLFGRAETIGVEQVMVGIVAATGEDLERIARAAAVLDSLYAAYQHTPG
jgi:hypothetical protein